MGSSLPPYDPSLHPLARFQFGRPALPNGVPQPHEVDSTMALVAELLAKRDRGELGPSAVDPGLPPVGEGEPGLLRQGWDKFSYPFKVLGGATGAVGGLAAGALDPSAYEAAQRELAGGIDPATLALAERARLAPGLGDVAAQWVPESVRESGLGTAVGPVARTIGNIAGDPTSYSPRLLLRLATLGRLRNAPAMLERAARVGSVGTALGETGAAVRVGEVGGALAGAGRVAAALPFSPVVGAAYVPELVEGVVAGGQEAFSQAQQGNTGQAAAQGVNSLLQAGLVALVRKGLMSEVRARQVASRAQAEAAPSGPVGGEEAQGAQVAPEEAAAAPARPAEAPAEAAPALDPQVAQQALVDFQVAAQRVLDTEAAPGTPVYQAFQEAQYKAQEEGHQDDALQGLLDQLAPRTQAPPAPAPEVVAPKPQPRPTMQEGTASPEVQAAFATTAPLPPKARAAKPSGVVLPYPEVSPEGRSSKGKPVATAAPLPPTPAAPAPAAAPAEGAAPTHPKYAEAVAALKALQAEGKAPSRANVLAAVKGITKGNDKTKGNSWGALSEELVAQGVLVRVPGKSGHLDYAPAAEEAVRIRPDLEIGDENLIDALRAHVVSLSERLPRAIGTPEAATLIDRIKKYTTALETMGPALKDPRRMGEAAPLIRELGEEFSPARPEKPPVGEQEARGEARYLERVRQGVPSGGDLRYTSGRPFPAEPVVPRETTPYVDRGSIPSPALYGAEGLPSTAAKLTLDKSGRVVRKVGTEKLPTRDITPEEGERLGRALGGIGFDLREQARQELVAPGMSRNKRLVGWQRGRLNADELASFNAQVKAMGDAPAAQGLAFYDRLEAVYLKKRPTELIRDYGKPGEAIKTGYAPGSPAGRVSMSPSVRKKVTRQGRSAEDALQESVRALVRRYADGDPEVRRVLDAGKPDELTALLRTGSERGTRKGMQKGEEGYVPRERELDPLMGTSKEPRVASPVDQEVASLEEAFPSVDRENWTTQGLASYALPKQAQRIVSQWHRANDGFDQREGTDRLSPEGRVQLAAGIRRLGDMVKAAEGVPDLRNRTLARLSNLISTYHGEFADFAGGRPWKKLEADLRLTYGLDVKGNFEEVARRVTGLEPIPWRTLRAETHMAETRGQAAGEITAREETGPSEPPFEESRRTTPSTPEWRLGPAEKAARAVQFAEAERSRSTPVEGHPDLAIIDYDGSGIDPREMDALQAYGQSASAPLQALHGRVAALLGRDYDFRGYTPSPAREGVFYKGAMQNPLYHLSDALEDARRVGGEDDAELVAAFSAQRAAWTATHEGLHSMLPHGDQAAEAAFETALRDLRSSVRGDEGYLQALNDLRQAVNADVVERFREAMPVFQQKVQEARRAVDSRTRGQRVALVLDRSRDISDSGRRGPGRDPGNLARGPGGGVRADSALPRGAGEAVPRGERGSPLTRGGPAQDAGAAPGRGEDRSPVGRGDERSLRNIPDEEAARIVGERSRPGEGWVENPTPENVAQMMQPYPEEALRLGPGRALSNAVGRVIGLGPDESPDQLSTRKIKLVLGNGPLGSKDPKAQALQEQILIEVGKGPQADDAAVAQSRPARGKKPLQPGELDVAVNFPKIHQAGSEQVRAALARALHATDPSLKRKPIRVKDVDAEVMRMLQTHDIDQTVHELQKRGIKDLYDLSLVRRYFSDQARELTQRQQEWADASAKGDVRGAKKAEQAMTLASMRAAIAGQAGSVGSTSAARMLALLRIEKALSEPLSPHEAFEGKFRQSLRHFGLTGDVAKEVYDALQDAVQTGDHRRFNEIFNGAFAPKDFKGRIRQALTYWKAGMMGAPTQFANVAGNASFKFLLRDVENVVAAGLERVFRGSKRERFLSEAKVAWLARRRAMGEAMGNLREDVFDLLTLQPPDLEKLSGRTSSQLDPVDIRSLEDVTKGKVHQFVMQPLKLMSAVDTFFQTLNRTEYLHRQAYRAARKSGLKGQAAYTRMDQIVGEMERGFADPLGVKDIENRNLAKRWAKELDYAVDEAKRDVFQGKYKRDVFGISGDALDRWSSAMPLLDLLIPFKKTPINVAKEAWRRLPLVGFYSAWKDLKAGVEPGKSVMDNPHFFDEMAKPVLGSAILTAVVMAGLEGEYLTGQGPVDPYQQQTLRTSGWQPYSFKIGNSYVPYNRFEPLATLLGMGADIAEAGRRGDIATKKELVERALGSIQQNLTNKTFLQGLESFFNFWSDPFRAGGKFLKQLSMSAVPNTVGWVPFGTLARAVDPVYRETNIVSAPASKVPFLSKALPPQYGTLGEVRKREGSALTRALFPIQITQGRDTPEARVAREIDRIGMNVQRPRTYVRSKGGRYDYSPEDQALLAGAQQRAIQAVAQLLQSPGYEALPDNEDDPRAALGVQTKEDLIRQVLMQYRRPVLSSVNTRASQALASRALSTLRSGQ